MSDVRPDRDLLREYLQTGSETAFRELVGRHARMVHATASRVTGTTDSAEEIAQSIFITLAKKAHWLAGHESLAGWLHRATILEARQWLRGEHRRRQREQHAHEIASVMHDKPTLSTEQLGLLDEALLGLTDADRQLVVLRHCEGHSYPEIARQLGLREDAVRKRCDHAMEQVIACFRKRSIVIGGMAALTAGLDSTSAAVSPAFAASATKAALAAAPIISLGVIPTLIGKFLALTKAQTIAITLALAAVPVAYEIGRMQTAGHDYQLASASLEEMEQVAAGANRDLRTATVRLVQAKRRNENAHATQNGPAQSTGAEKISWIDGMQYTRIPKSAVLGLHLSGLGQDWQPKPALRQLLGLNQQENQAVETALEAFTSEIARQNEKYLRRVPDSGTKAKPNEEIHEFVVEAHDSEAKEAARTLEAQVLQALGAERGRMALRNFHLPLLPDGTTDYETNPDYNNGINGRTAPSQGLEWHITFHRFSGEKQSAKPYVQVKYVNLQQASMMETQDREFTHVAIPPTLRSLWQQWKSGVIISTP